MPEVKKETKLLPFLFEEMPEISRSRLKQFLRDGRILVNGKSVTQHDAPLVPGDKVVLSSEKTVRSADIVPRKQRKAKYY